MARDAPVDDADAPNGAPYGHIQVLGPAQRFIEAAAIAVVTSTGLYLVGSVYTDAYYGRMSIEVTSLDLSPPYITGGTCARESPRVSARSDLLLLALPGVDLPHTTVAVVVRPRQAAIRASVPADRQCRDCLPAGDCRY